MPQMYPMSWLYPYMMMMLMMMMYNIYIYFFYLNPYYNTQMQHKTNNNKLFLTW